MPDSCLKMVEPPFVIPAKCNASRDPEVTDCRQQILDSGSHPVKRSESGMTKRE
ncbi:MAG: hypothetical protein QNK25_02480 [Desulfobacterales bacterium]|nr:hypothetical protein [Desulfobacterales bacterium]